MRIRKIVSGTPSQPRMTVYRSNKQIYVQFIDDLAGVTLATASSLDKEVAEAAAGKNKCEVAALVGKLAAERGIAENVDFLGYRRDINNLVGLSDLSVASSFQEGLPINLIEAMAMGNPIVATDVRGNNDAVEDGVNGYLVPVGDSGMMAEKILELMNDREKLRTFGENGLDMVRDFSTENVNREMLTIYSNLGLI